MPPGSCAPNGTSGRRGFPRAVSARAGRFNVILGVDEINAPLRRMVEYLNATTRPEVDVIAVELARVNHGGTEILLPRTYGAELATATEPASSRQPSWTEGDYLHYLRDTHPLVASAMEALVDGLKADGWEMFNGTAARPAVTVGRQIDGRASFWPVSLLSEGRGDRGPVLQIRLWNVVDQGGNAAETLALLAHIPGIEEIDRASYESAGYRRDVTLPAALFVEPAAREGLLTALKAARP